MSADAADMAGVLERVCGAFRTGDRAEATRIVRGEYPFRPLANAGRRANETQSMRVFLRDRFTCHYSGARMVFPGTLRLLSILLPDEFPYHTNWKMTATHIAFWELFPAIDHVVPVARGGADDESNWVTTSMLRNSAKANWTLDELGWVLLGRQPTSNWDGLTAWATRAVEDRPEFLSDKYVARWHRAAIATANAP